LYQIESGKTELPRAGTLRRIALALDVSMETLLGHAEEGGASTASATARRGRGSAEWVPAEGGPLTVPAHRVAATVESLDGSRFAVEPKPQAAIVHDGLIPQRERELAWKLHEVLASPLGEAVARIIEESYRILPQSRALG
jgi:transcriptional regulator with XRE-family HTH domain